MIKLPRPISTNHPLGIVINEIIRALEMMVPHDGKNTRVRRTASGFAIDATSESQPASKTITGGGITVARWQ